MDKIFEALAILYSLVSLVADEKNCMTIPTKIYSIMGTADIQIKAQN